MDARSCSRSCAVIMPCSLSIASAITRVGNQIGPEARPLPLHIPTNNVVFDSFTTIASSALNAVCTALNTMLVTLYLHAVNNIFSHGGLTFKFIRNTFSKLSFINACSLRLFSERLCALCSLFCCSYVVIACSFVLSIQFPKLGWCSCGHCSSVTMVGLSSILSCGSFRKLSNSFLTACGSMFLFLKLR